MDSPVVHHSFFIIVRSFLVRLGPLVSIELGVALAARAFFPREVRILLYEPGVTRVTFHPSIVALGEQARCLRVVARHPDPWGFILNRGHDLAFTALALVLAVGLRPLHNGLLVVI